MKTSVVDVDVADEKSCKAMVDTHGQAVRPCRHPHQQRGHRHPQAARRCSVEEWRKVLSINLDGAFYCAQAVYPALKKSGGGKIINIGSMMSIFGAPFAAPYAASKGGIVQLTKALATAWAKDNIQVNAVLPGWIDTDLTQQARRDVDGLHDRVLARTPAGRWGVPDDFSGIAVFLGSQASDFVTGSAIPVCGGYSVMV